jgi:hypothetical protein
MTRLLALGGVVVGLLLAGPVAAQSTADSYFHEAAQAYVDGDEAAARRAVTRGLEVAPSDPRLMALRDKLREGGRPDGRRDSSATESGSRTQQGANTDTDEASEGGEDPSASDTEGPTQSGPQAQARGSEPGPGARSGTQRSDAPSDPSDGQRQGGGSAQRPSDAPPDPMRRGRGGQPVDTLSRAQAERLLRALEGQERRLLRQLRPRTTQRRRVEKDW